MFAIQCSSLSFIILHTCEQHCSHSSHANRAKVPVEGSLANISDTKSADGEEMPTPHGDGEEGERISKKDTKSTWESNSFEISLEEIIPVTCPKQSKLCNNCTFVLDR